jgi:hypothetical protein
MSILLWRGGGKINARKIRSGHLLDWHSFGFSMWEFRCFLSETVSGYPDYLFYADSCQIEIPTGNIEKTGNIGLLYDCRPNIQGISL